MFSLLIMMCLRFESFREYLYGFVINYANIIPISARFVNSEMCAICKLFHGIFEQVEQISPPEALLMQISGGALYIKMNNR